MYSAMRVRCATSRPHVRAVLCCAGNQRGVGRQFPVPEIDSELRKAGSDCYGCYEGQRTTDIEPEPSATFGDQSQDLRLVREAAAQQNQPGLEVVLDIRQLEALVQSNLAVRELDALLAVVDLRVGPTCLDRSNAARLRRRVIRAVASVFGVAGRLGGGQGPS